MPKRFVERVRSLQSHLTGRGFTEFATSQGDRRVSSQRMSSLKQAVGEKLEQLERNPSDKALFELHREVEAYRAQGGFALPEAMLLLEEIEHRIKQSRPVKRLAEQLSEFDLNNLYISPKNAEYLMEQSAFPEHHRNLGYEVSGSAKIVKTEKGFEIVPVTQSIEDHAPSTVAIDLPAFFKSGSHLFWHTHPAGSSQQRNSLGDRGLIRQDWHPDCHGNGCQANV